MREIYMNKEYVVKHNKFIRCFWIGTIVLSILLIIGILLAGLYNFIIPVVMLSTVMILCGISSIKFRIQVKDSRVTIIRYMRTTIECDLNDIVKIEDFYHDYMIIRFKVANISVSRFADNFDKLRFDCYDTLNQRKGK